MLVGSSCVPAGFRPVAVIVPLIEGDIVLAEKVVEKPEDVVTNVLPCEVQDELIVGFSARASREIKHPIRMFAVKVAVGVDHLGLDPQAKVHAE